MEKRCGYTQGDGFAIGTHPVFEPSDFPLYVCVKRDDFSDRELYLLEFAIGIWNGSYRNYIRERWPDRRRLRGVPKGDLFEIGCEASMYRTIDVSKSRLRKPLFGLVDYNRWSWFFLGSILIINEDINFDLSVMGKGKNSLMAVFMHELGHTIGIPHLKDDTLMFPTINLCNDNREKCIPGPLAFESFLEMYRPFYKAG